MSEHERTQRIESPYDQDSTRRLSSYEERDYTQRLDVPPAPPWDPEDRQRDREPAADRRRDRDEKRTWPTSLVVVALLVGLLLGVLGTLVATGSTRGEVQALEDQVASAQEAVDARDQRIAELERQLEDERNSPIPNVPLPDISIPSVPDVPLPDTEQGRELLEQLLDRLSELVGSSG
jgi:hypothetical protein